jgi:hypothetical protein
LCFFILTFVSVSFADPGSGAFLSPGSGIRIRDPGWSNGRIRIRDPGSGIRDKLTKFVNRGRIRDPVLFTSPDPGSGSGMEQWSDPDLGSGFRNKTSRIRNTGLSVVDPETGTRHQ